MIPLLLFILGMYIAAESLQAAKLMDRGDRLCRLMKYLGTAIAGCYGMYISVTSAWVWQDLIWAITLALWVWPKMLRRLGFRDRRRAGDRLDDEPLFPTL